MGGGIAINQHTNIAHRHETSIVWNDLGIGEATRIVEMIVKLEKSMHHNGTGLANINPTLSYGKADFADVDVVVEAVVENIKVKHMVLAEVEKYETRDGYTSNTSSISIDILAAYGTSRKLLWYAFFNPVQDAFG